MVFICSLWGRLDGYIIWNFDIIWCLLRQREVLKGGEFSLDWVGREGFLEYVVFELIFGGKMN